jgi:hypothetical protein
LADYIPIYLRIILRMQDASKRFTATPPKAETLVHGDAEGGCACIDPAQ